MNNPTLNLDILCSKGVFVSLDGSYFVGDSQRCLSGDWLLHADQNNIIVENDDEIIVVGNSVIFEPMDWEGSYFILKEEGSIHENKNYYKGSIHVLLWDGKVKIENEVDIDFFINSVLNRRYADNDQLEFLKVQVVLLRSYLLKYRDKINSTRLLEPKSDNDIFLHKNNFIEPKPDQLQFMYAGCSLNLNDVVNKAVEQTKGVAIFHNSSIVCLPVTYCCGGITANSYYFGDELIDNYLKSACDSKEEIVYDLNSEDSFCNWLYKSESCFCNENSEDLLSELVNIDIGNRSNLYRWNKHVSKDDVSLIVSRLTNKVFESVDGIEVLERSVDGNVMQLAIRGGDKDIVLQGSELLLFSAYLGLSSIGFVVKKIDGSKGANNGFVFNGIGKGHRAGLCLVGAMEMSQEGFVMEEIVKHYFKDVYISKQY